MQKRWKTNLSSTSENAFTIHGFWVHLSKKDLKPHFNYSPVSTYIINVSEKTGNNSLNSDGLHRSSHMLAHGKFIAFKNLFFSFRWIISWNSVPGLLRAVFHFATEIEEGQSKDLKYLANFWSARTPFLAAFTGLARWAQVGYFPFAESGKLPRWAIEATRLGCEPWLRGRKFPDDSPRQLTAPHLGPPSPPFNEICHKMIASVHQQTTLGHLVLPMIHQQPTYFWKQFSSDLGPGPF